METFSAPRPLVESPHYQRDRQDALRRLDPGSLDEPILELITAFNTLACCFTRQSCCGHFISRPDQDDHNCEPVPALDCGPVRYRIAYVALCLAREGPCTRVSVNWPRAIRPMSSLDLPIGAGSGM